MNHIVRLGNGLLIRIGAEAGAAAGIVYLLGEELAAMLSGVSSVMPLRLFASVLLGSSSFSSAANTASIAALGGMVALLVTTVFGAIFAILVHLFPCLTATPGTLVIAGATYGLFLWLGCFYVLGTFFWPWFLQTNPTTQFVLATFGYGVGLGLGFVLARVHRSPSCLF
ncbi:MAG TPA: hypothetical protein VKX96_15685 [Chloroflexota bacterium]|nr:hypothetical protein [Chloroflexota bacterium]